MEQDIRREAPLGRIEALQGKTISFLCNTRKVPYRISPLTETCLAEVTAPIKRIS